MNSRTPLVVSTAPDAFWGRTATYDVLVAVQDDVCAGVVERLPERLVRRGGRRGAAVVGLVPVGSVQVDEPRFCSRNVSCADPAPQPPALPQLPFSSIMCSRPRIPGVVPRESPWRSCRVAEVALGVPRVSQLLPPLFWYSWVSRRGMDHRQEPAPAERERLLIRRQPAAPVWSSPRRQHRRDRRVGGDQVTGRQLLAGVAGAGAAVESESVGSQAMSPAAAITGSPAAAIDHPARPTDGRATTPTTNAIPSAILEPRASAPYLVPPVSRQQTSRHYARGDADKPLNWVVLHE